MNGSAPRWLLWAAIGFLLWDLMGVASFINEWTLSPEAIAALPQRQQDMVRGMNLWIWTAFAIGVFGGLIGAIGLLIKKAWSVPFLCASMIAVIAQFGYIFVKWNLLTTRFDMAILPLCIIAMAIIAWHFPRKWRNKGWLT